MSYAFRPVRLAYLRAVATIGEIIIFGQTEAGIFITRAVRSDSSCTCGKNDDRLTGGASQMCFGKMSRQFTGAIFSCRFRNGGCLIPRLRRAKGRCDDRLATQIRLSPANIRVRLVHMLRRCLHLPQGIYTKKSNLKIIKFPFGTNKIKNNRDQVQD